ncbi:FtsB family cell division protein [Solibacillus daqui]|uniref:FtsB family cell division protein n=1 Tax=Solibacillus daqui TaxID=2912187 RepID=UPI002366A7F5|nr:septum formation initiator family protein [Solibacillus daqui]
MGKRDIQDELHNNVQPLDNEFVRSNPNAKIAKQKAKKAVLLRRRLAIFLIIAVASIVGLAQFSSMQNERLADKQIKKAEVNAQLEESLEKQEMLNLQIAKLEDDEYIAKLARKEFFLSEEGEIIFTIPKTSDNKDEKTDSDKKDE